MASIDKNGTNEGTSHMQPNETDIERVAKVISTWQRRHPGVMDTDPEWAAINLALDLAHAGEIMPGSVLPEQDA